MHVQHNTDVEIAISNALLVASHRRDMPVEHVIISTEEFESLEASRNFSLLSPDGICGMLGSVKVIKGEQGSRQIKVVYDDIKLKIDEAIHASIIEGKKIAFIELTHDEAVLLKKSLTHHCIISNIPYFELPIFTGDLKYNGVYLRVV
jgi:hypothetical protein